MKTDIGGSLFGAVRAAQSRYGPVPGWACAGVTVAIAIVLRYLLNPVLGSQFPFATIFLAILVTAWLGGFRAAMGAVLLGAVGARIFLMQASQAGGRDLQIGLTLYLFTGAGIALLAGSMHRALRRAEDIATVVGRQALLLDQTYDAVLVWEFGGHVTLWNRGAERLYGVSAEEAIGRRADEVVAVSGSERNRLIPTLERDGDWEGILQHKGKDGQAITVESRMVLVRDTEPPCVVECNRNITQRVLAEQALLDLNSMLQHRVEERTAELVRANEALQVSEERNRIILEGVRSHALFTLDAAGNVDSWNQGAGRIIGYSEPDIVGKPFSVLYRPEDIQPGRPPAELGLIAGQSCFEEECLLVRRDGSQFWAVVTITRLAAAGATPSGFITVIRDISERRLIQEALRASEERFRLLVDGVSDYAILMLDPGGRIMTWNRGAENLEGYAASEMVGQHYSRLFTPEAIALGVPDQELVKAAAEGKSEVEGWRLRKNGTRFWVNGTISALYGEHGRVLGFAKVTRDFTAKRRNDELLQSVLNHTVDGIISIDDHGVISTINGAGEKLFGRTANEVVGQNVKILMPEPYHSRHEHYLRRYLLTGDARIIGIGREVEAVRSDGTTFPVELAVTEFQLDNQRNFVGIVRDISEKKRLEAQLNQSRKMDAFGQLAGGVAHDFNNLLTVISGYSSVLLGKMQSDDPQRKMVEQIGRAGERAASLTRQLLAFSRKQLLEPKVLDLNAAVGETGKMLRRLIGEDIEFTTISRTKNCLVRIDPGQLEQVILNLAVNARDAMPLGGRLTLETSEVALDEAYTRSNPDATVGHFVMLAVSDTGCGMAPDLQRRVFEPFFTTKGSDGTGLGLAVVHGIVKQSGGSINVYSEVGIGTTFKIYLPRIEAWTEPQIPQARPGLTGGRETILLVEDDEGVRELSSSILQDVGYTVLTAPSGKAAIQLMGRAHEIDLLVTDVVMPEMSGRKLAELLLSLYPDLKVLYISGYTDDAVVRHGLLHSNVDFLQKPFSPEALTLKIREVLEARGLKARGTEGHRSGTSAGSTSI